MNEEKETKNIRAVLILEAIGKPPEHLTQTLENLAKQIDEEKGAKVLNKKIKEPVQMKEQKEFYTTFAEVEIEVEEILYLAILMFKYMPAHLEIVEPELIALTNNGWNDIFNELTRRLHGYDEVARVLQTEKAILEKRLREATGKEQGKTEQKPVQETKQENQKKKTKKENKKF